MNKLSGEDYYDQSSSSSEKKRDVRPVDDQLLISSPPCSCPPVNHVDYTESGALGHNRRCLQCGKTWYADKNVA